VWRGGSAWQSKGIYRREAMDRISALSVSRVVVENLSLPFGHNPRFFPARLSCVLLPPLARDPTVCYHEELKTSLANLARCWSTAGSFREICFPGPFRASLALRGPPLDARGPFTERVRSSVHLSEIVSPDSRGAQFEIASRCWRYHARPRVQVTR